VQRLEGNHETYFKVLYPFYNWMGETGVPGFFFISGFLFFLSKKSYSQKLKTRVHTLLIPFLLWNTFLILLYVIAYVLGHPQDIYGRSLADYHFIDYLRLYWDRGAFDNGNFVPLLCPLWYIRNLLIMSILSPLLYYITRFARELFLVIIAVWWLMSYHNAFIPQTVLFFSLGAYFSIHNINPLKIVAEHRTFFLSSFVFFAFADLVSHLSSGTPINLQLHRLALIFNIPALFLLANYCARHGYTNAQLSNAAFIVFCVHYPIVVVIRKVSIAKFADASDYVHILLYFVCVIIATIISLGIYQLLDRYFPKTKKILSGNR
jgi:peptidoglycan/LPS O-acetylase OafA/YrhL